MANLSDCRILIVDDQPANVTALETVLGFAGYTNMKGLSDSREVLTFFTEFAPDLVLLDLHMPHVDGLAVIDLLTGGDSPRRLPADSGAHGRRQRRGETKGALTRRP